MVMSKISLKKCSAIFFLLIAILICSCKIISQTKKQNGWKKIRLNFENCTIAFDNYNSVSLRVPSGYYKEKVFREGLCEYRFIYKDSSAYYISNDVWFGSNLNFPNREAIGHSAYAKERLNDTISIGGRQPNGLYWMESILGNITVGYINISDTQKRQFEKVLASIKKE